MKSTVFALLLATACGVAVVGLSSQNVPTPPLVGSGETPPGLRLGEAPGRWVPFEASMIRVFRAGESVVGKLYRASDGSTRNETGPAPGRVNIIGIKNMSDRLYYIWRPESGWESRRIDLPRGRYVQPPEGAPPGGTRLKETVDGLSLIRMPTDRQGITEDLAPELNYHPVRTLMPCNDGQGSGCGLWLVDVKVGEQPADLFRLPSGEVAVARTEPSRTQRAGVQGVCAHPQR